MARADEPSSETPEQPVIRAVEAAGPMVEIPVMMFVDVMTALLDPTPETRERAAFWFDDARELIKAAREQDDRGDVRSGQ